MSKYNQIFTARCFSSLFTNHQSITNSTHTCVTFPPFFFNLATLSPMAPNPFTGRTPEALVGRNDSKNPATTCRGITNSGRPCRRALARKSGLVAVVEDGDGTVEEASYYCHDHKAQAGSAGPSTSPPGRTKTNLYTLDSRNSVDTLVQRLGVEGVGSEISTKVRRKRHDGRHRPESRQDAPYGEKYGLGQGEGRQSKKKEKSSFWSMLCCGGGGQEEDDYVEIVRRKKRLQDSRPSNTSSRPPAPSSPGRQSRPTTDLPLRPAANTASPNSQAGNLLSLIPPTVSPTTASALLAELSKPPNPNDEEGYIYIFWLTPNQDKAPDTSTARSLLSPENHPRRERRISDVVSEFSYTAAEQTRSANPRDNGKAAKPTILLKIGRANNVTRRMNEWQRQCGYALSLVRWYPYVSSSAAPSPAPSSPGRNHGRSRSASASASRPDGARRESSGLVRKVPCVKRVERLIHLELAERRITKDCEVCGREHREWFEVDGTEKGVKSVDETVRRWVAWGESQVQ
jgi:hypothetical protein